MNNACEYDACNKECSGSSDLAVHKREQDEDEHVESGGQDKIFPVSSASMVCDTTVNDEECDVFNEGYIDRQCLDEHKCYHVSDALCNTCGREIFESKSMQQPSAVKSDVTSNSCDKCNEQFPCSFETLEQHQTSGHGTTRQCDSCK